MLSLQNVTQNLYSMKHFLLILTLLCNLSTMAQEPVDFQTFSMDGWRQYSILLPSDISYCEEESNSNSFNDVYYNKDKSFRFQCYFLKTDEDFRPHEWLAGEFAQCGIEFSSYDQFDNLMIGNGYINVHCCINIGNKVLSIGIFTNLQYQGWAAFIYATSDVSLGDIACRVISSFRLYQPENQEE